MANRGANDMIVLYQNSGNGPIRVNIFKNKNSTDLNKLCSINANNLDFPYPGFDSQDMTKSNEHLVTYTLPHSDNYLYEDEEDPNMPPLVNIGDLNLDGIADMALVMTTGTKGNKDKAYVVPFKGEKCSAEA